MKKLLPIIVVLAILAALMLAACDHSMPDIDADIEEESIIITDVYGREVEIPSQINSLICTGTGCLRLVAYVDALDLLVGVEDTDKDYQYSTKRDYAYVYYDQLADLPAIGKGGGAAYTAYAEEIIMAAPDVILSCYDQEAAEQLAADTGLPVVCVRYYATGFIDQSFTAALSLTGEITGRTARAAEILDYIDAAKADLLQRSSSIADEDKPSVYTGAVTYSGAHGFAGTYANFGPFLAIAAKNVADETNEPAAFDVDWEKVLVWDPQVIFLDPGNMDLVHKEYQANPSYFAALSAVKNNQLYALPAFNNYSTNITYALLAAYYAGTVLYPQQFSDIVMQEKAAEVLKFFLHEDYYPAMIEEGMGYGPLTLGE